MAGRNNKIIITRTFFIFLTSFSFQFHSSTAKLNWVKAGYWYAGSDFPISDINSALFTHLICAFANVNSSTFELSIPPNFQKSFSNFTNIVKQKNPLIITLLSIWNGQPETYKAILGKPVNNSVLSSMIKEPSKRRSFIQSSITTARLNGFQGIDLFWLWPNGTDLSGLGVLLDEWRAAIDSEPINPSTGSKLALTIGVRYSPNLEIISYPIDSMKKNLDWAHVVAYDYHVPSMENFTGNHAGLYNPTSNISTDFGIKGWLDGGFPAGKLVLGLPYHGYAWTLVNPGDTYVGAPASGPAVTLDGSIGYRFTNSFIQNYGYGAKPVYSSTYVVNYFVVGSTWINYDDVEAIRVKVAYAKEKGLLGYNVFQVINDDNWALSLAALQAGERQENKKRLLLKVLLPIAAIIVLFVSVMCFCRRRVLKGKGLNSLRNNILANMGRSSIGEHDDPSLQVFSFAKIKAATNNFSIENKLGEGGFGPVYKGKLPKGQEIAVKRLSVSSTQGLEEFKNEVSLTAKLQHVNLVRVIGYCIERGENMLIYEYMPNRSLDRYLFNPERGYMLDWDKRTRIIEGITQGLLYLQEYSNFRVIHRDLKANNILLDKEMKPKISDFGMARTFNKDLQEANTSRIVGTYGYVPPEYVTKGRYSMKYDVYSFGVLLLQIISGKRNSCCYCTNENLNLLEYAYESWKNEKVAEFVDPSLDDSASPCKLVRCMEVALLCVQENPEDRPAMLEVFSMLKSETVAIAVSKSPAFSVKKEEAWETTSTSHHEIYSFDDSQSSQLEPR